MKNRIIAAVISACSVLVAAASAQAQTTEIPPIELRVIGANSTLNMWTDLERQWYGKTIPDASSGRVKIEALPHDLAGLKGPEVLFFLQNGTVQFASQAISYMAGEDPRFEAVDLAGLTMDVPSAVKAIDAYRPVLERVLAERFNVKLLGLAPMSSQVFWCRGAVDGIDSFKGKKIRVFNSSLSDLVSGLGGVSITIPFVEAVPALQRGVADCGVTGAISGHRAKWQDVTKTLYPLNSGWSTMFWGANLDAWKSLPVATQDFLSEQYKKMEIELAAMAQEGDREAISCASGGECSSNNRGKMSFQPLSEQDQQRRLEILESHVLPNWAKRCGAECVQEWNDTVGKALDLRAEVK